MKSNQDIRETALQCNVHHWEIAQELGISETYFCKKLRKELPEDEKFKIIGIIGQIAKEKEADGQ